MPRIGPSLANLVSAIVRGFDIDSKLRPAIRSAIRSTIRSAIRSAIRFAIRSAIISAMRSYQYSIKKESE